ncbi:DNA-binding protein [Methylobacterium sp. P1-11]|uniref:DNA-binding protein n=1 Tax=Methylobacterium sp. P1-11 TaxID=2024616 RepID=UPI0018D8A896|nr:DNA-binding protein [Methylobacterium sp. P1-11]
MRQGEQMKIRLPADLKAFVAGQAERYGNSQNAEIVRAVRERMERTLATTGVQFGDQAPAAAHEAARKGDPVTHG